MSAAGIYESKRTLPAILALALAVRLLMVMLPAPELRSDSLTYDKLAASVLSGSYSMNGKPTAFVVPGYPVFLAAVYSILGKSESAVRVAQSFVDVLTCLLFYFVCRKIFDRKHSVIALAVFAFFPSNMIFSQAVLTETLFGFFAMAVLNSLMRNDLPRGLLFTGLLFGIAILVRSSYSIAALTVPLYLFAERKEIFRERGLFKPAFWTVAFFTVMMLVLSPWLARNKEVMGAVTLATQGGSTLWEGNNPKATGTWNKAMVDAEPLFNEPDEVKREKEFRSRALSFIAGNPAKFVELGIRKLAYLFSSERMALLYFSESPAGMTSTQVYRSINPLLTALVNLPYFAVMLAGAWGLLMKFNYRFPVAGFVLAWMFTMFVFVALPRYHYVLIPFFVIGAVNLLAQGREGLMKLSFMKKMAGAAFTLFLLGVWTAEFLMVYAGEAG